KAVEMLHHLRSFDIEIDVDDFGTGYSNLGYLASLPISTLKVDRTFVMEMEKESVNHEIVRTIISLAKNLGLAVTAEGIETERQLEALRELGCNKGQGYYLAQPMNKEDLLDMVYSGSLITPISSPSIHISHIPTLQ